MRALDLDIVRRRPLWPGWVVLIVGIALVADAGLRHQRLLDTVDEMQRPRSVSKYSQTSGGAQVSEQTRRELDSARRLLQELVLPWEPLFRSIEGSVDPETGLLAIEPDAERRAVRITGEARNYRSVLDFVDRLGQKPGLARIHLLNHQIREDVAEHPFVFTLTASWGATP
jgi:hypothetical protein